MRTALATHVVYSYEHNQIIYFNGRIIPTRNPKEVDIEWSWTKHKHAAQTFPCCDAWDLLRIARQTWEDIPIEVERICDFEEI